MAKFLDLTGLTQFKNKIQEWAQGLFLTSSQKGQPNGVAELDDSGKVPSSQLPSYVDDVLEFDSQSAFPGTGETGKIYVAKDSNKTYRWSGSGYIEISASLALGETSSTAYRGDRGKAAYDHSQLTSGNPHNVTKTDVGLGNVTNDKQMKGLVSGTTQDHVIVFGADGYTPKDSGFTIGISVPANAKFTDTTYSAFNGATGSAAGGAGLVPAPTASDNEKYLKGDGTWGSPTFTVPDEYVTDTELDEKGYQTASQVSYAIATAVEDAISAAAPSAISTTEIDALFDQ